MLRVPLIFLLYVICSLTFTSLAQEDSIYHEGFSGKVGTGFISSSRSFLPFYLVMNRSGEVSDSPGVFQIAEFHYNNDLTKRVRLTSGIRLRNKVISNHYVGLSYGKMGFRLGRYNDQLGGIEDNTLTTGSLAYGTNAQPIPKVEIVLNDYLDLPYTHGYIKVKGGLSHGWFEKDRYISQALLHQKYAKVLVDLEPLIGSKIYSSIIHFAQYGGTSIQGERLPSSFQDYRKVFFGQGIPNPMGGTAGESNAVGNHVGITEWTWDQRVGRHRLQINYQKPFEDQGSMQYISFKDFLIGLRLQYPEGSKIKSIYFEWIRTMSQSGPGLPDPFGSITNEEENFGYEFGGRDDYYNNYLYQDGWTYKGRILSNPIFLTYHRSLNFISSFPNYNNQVVNNRVNGFHIGAMVEPIEGWSIRSMFTYSINYGTYAGLYEGRFSWEGIKTKADFDYVFLGGKKQFYSLIDFAYETTLFEQPVKYKGMFAFDIGQLYNSVGAELALEFMLK